MAKWIEVYKNRECKNPIILDEEKILYVDCYDALEEVQIVYLDRFLVQKSFWIKKKKDAEEYEYFRNLAKNSA